MKGVILAGGNGTRLQPMTKVTNKHLLPLYDKPIIYYPIEKMVQAGVDRIMIVTSPHHLDDFVSLLGSGENWRSKRTGKQIQIVYGIQNEPRGIANALWIAKDYVGQDNCLLMLGDNVMEDNLKPFIESFATGAQIFLKKVSDPTRFGIATLDSKGLVKKIVEKPKKPASNWAVIGAYLYDNSVFDKMIDLPPSVRGEYEITEVNNKYLKQRALNATKLKGKWFDVGTFDSLLAGSLHYQKKTKRSK
ncbi:MAG: spore coat protein [Candidatus Vogelbacteria bacterium CG10_big_fil_rev_8_21_14_0_10_49_38]|uniref:glucose-1-phosphate thymidylyltransferase n=1 Tax=Candidatus Vogelbacteria bacterium CG10_big_fil_rev_8_21_14_0_10_49_38 TaxID=1975043 RepID=A0A2H0RI48_9BACT|nr:MAG: hypothetical protein BK006_01645 [bacterium CG10_49_38]PIR46127.1 MAG: spore coat protein [Candidatus Vogelbacteria bacterium CG10_big_fil_rev_8_21_14_0_10_49_38]